jgi:hypothetical protein
MRKAQNVVKFGLKLGAFAALAASLSSCFLVIDNGGGTPSIDTLVAQSTFCRGGSLTNGNSTNIDFRLNATNISVEAFETIVTAVGAENGTSDPLTVLEGKTSATNISRTTAITGTGTLRSSVTLTMTDLNEFAPNGLALKSIKPNAVGASIALTRLWVRAVYSGGKTTGWLASAQLTATDGSTCDPSF